MTDPLRMRRAIAMLIAATCLATTVATSPSTRQDVCARHHNSVRATAGASLHAQSRRVPSHDGAIVPHVEVHVSDVAHALIPDANARSLASTSSASAGRAPPAVLSA